jgi:hypothetical protein
MLRHLRLKDNHERLWQAAMLVFHFLVQQHDLNFSPFQSHINAKFMLKQCANTPYFNEACCPAVERLLGSTV